MQRERQPRANYQHKLPGPPLHPAVVMRGAVVENGEPVVDNAGAGDGILHHCGPCNKIVEVAKAEALTFVAEKTVAFGRALGAEGKAAFESGKQDLRNYVSQHDVVVSVGIAGMLGTPIGPNTAPLGLTALGDLGVVANLSSGQIGLQANLGLVPSVGGGAVASGNFQGGLNNGPLETGFSTSNVAFAQATAVTATGTPLDVGGAVQWSSGGGVLPLDSSQEWVVT